MSIRASLLVVVLAFGLLLGCDNRSSTPVSPAASTATQLSEPGSAAASPATVVRGGPEGKERTVVVFDACDPETFNDALGAGTCVRNGGVRFDKFLELLGRHHSVG